MGRIFDRFRAAFFAVVLMASVLTVGGMATSVPVFAANKYDKELCNSDIDEDVKKSAGCETDNNLTQKANNVIGTMIGVISFLAVLVIVFAGQRYVVAQGEPGKIKQAREMILYAGIALVVALLAWAIISFVSGAITSNANTGV